MVRGLKAPPRRALAFVLTMAWAVVRSCSSLSTAHGPAIINGFMIRIKFTQLNALAKHIFKELESQKLLALQKTPEEILALIASVFNQNMEEERKLDEEAHRLLEQNKRKIGLTIDEERALQMIKKQLAKERNFVL